ncbi:MAG: hypothetical protein V2I37_01940 [Marinilabiliaceae bacterium]|jgi:hypothetical protein|nr:hypothetical protein [Marinilabiliaceae bacterium]
MNYPIYNRILFLVICSHILLVVACNSNTKSEENDIENKWYGKQIILPNQKENALKSINQDGLKIVTRINGHCYSCLLQLKEWQRLIEDVSLKGTISYYIYVVVPDSIYFNNVNSLKIRFNYPIIYDPNDEFRKHNDLEEDSNLHTMLLDSTNRVLGIGNPILNPNILIKYKNIIKRQKDDKKKNVNSNSSNLDSPYFEFF